VLRVYPKNLGILRCSINAIEEKRTTLSLSFTASDKKVLKMIALEKDTTIAAVMTTVVAIRPIPPPQMAV